MSDDDSGPRPSAAPESASAPADAPPGKDARAPSEKPPTNWWGELRAIMWLVLAVLAFHSLIAKPFYIPSESMMPGLIKGDRLVVSKYPYGWSWVSPSFHILPHWSGRLFGSLPEPGDVVIVTPPGGSSDYIKRVIGLPGDTIAMVGGQLIINGRPVRRERLADAMLPVDENSPCEPLGSQDGRASGQFSRDYRVTGEDGTVRCRVPIIRETLPNGRSYDTIDDVDGAEGDDYGPVTVPDGHVFLMGDNRDHSADSRFPLGEPYNGLGGPVPWENIGGRAEFVTFSLDGSSQYWNPISWFTALRGGRSGTSLHPERAQPEAQAQ
ncbi:MAG TPA: signal peptidase I [Allosphingosinicella sp.]